jgi:hypothetical protein
MVGANTIAFNLATLLSHRRCGYAQSDSAALTLSLADGDSSGASMARHALAPTADDDDDADGDKINPLYVALKAALLNEKVHIALVRTPSH